MVLDNRAERRQHFHLEWKKRGKWAKVYASHGPDMQIWPKPNLKDTPPNMAAWNSDAEDGQGQDFQKLRV